MKLFDLHSHWGTREGYVLRTKEALAQQKSTWNSTPQYDTEEEMAAYLRANQVRITTVSGKADKVMASGNVVVDSPASGTATGDNGVYSVGPRTVLMTGNVTLKKGKDVMRGAQLTVNLNSGQAVLGGGVKGQSGGSNSGQPNGRVQGVFLPNAN